VALPLGLRGARPAARLARADELLERVGLADRRAARPGELSGGEQQRVAVCAALAHRPRLLLADEPTGELDERNAELIFGVIGELAREQSCTAVVVSHDPAAASVADRVVRIRDGRVAEEALRDGDRREDAIVLGKGGWLRLPEEYLARAGIHGRANARLEHRRIVVSPVDGDGAAPPPEPGDDGRPRLTPRPGLGAELRDVDKTFGRGPAARTVLRGLSVRLQSATLYALTGPSGSGKTTLLELLAGLQQPDAGVIVVGGEVISELARERRARLRAEHVGFVPQAPVLTPFLSARENVELALTVRGVAPQEAAERAVAALDAVGLSERLDQRVSRLSSGERGRVAIARALGGRPALLLADEPTSRLDQGNALAVAALLARLAHETGATVVCATHDPLVLEQAHEQIELAGRLG